MNIIEYFKNRKQRKQRIVLEVKEAKAIKKQTKKEIAMLPKEEQNKIKQELRLAKKEEKRVLKLQLKEMSRGERRKIKKDRKIFKKVYNRPRRLVGWSIVVIVLGLIVNQIGPLVSDIVYTMSGKDVQIDTTTPQAIAAREYGESVSEEIVNEGIILLQNNDNYLPYEKDVKVNVFGISAHNFRYGGGGSGATSDLRAIGFYDALDEVGIKYNTDLKDFYGNLTNTSKEGAGFIQVIEGMFGLNKVEEPEKGHLTEVVLNQAKEYSDNAIIVLTSSGSEASDFTNEQLTLSQNKRDLIETVTSNFDNVTIIINAGNAIELGFVEEYPQIKSVVWTGTPGPFGTRSLANVLIGNINPSGRTTDTYAYNPSSSPASVNFGDYQYENLNKAFIVYQEGIYVGYRYYETFYQNDEVGYQNTVQYPFGYGLSYTTFAWETINQTNDNETIYVDVKVTNTGDKAGKDVVQLYYSAPYYEGGIEKSAIELGTYEKTSLLQPGESEIVSLTLNTRDMASYDYKNEQAYILENGVYEIKVSRDVHNPIDTFNYTVNETIIYREDEDTKVTYENRFDYADGDYTYLSRNDWEGTYPNDDTLSTIAPQDVVDKVNDTAIPTNKESTLQYGIDKEIQLESLKDIDINDPLWDEFIDQFTANELIHLVTHGAYKTVGFEKYGIQQSKLMDGPAGISFFFGTYDTAGYPSELLIATSWNKELAYKMGEAVGKEANAYGVQGWYAPAMNLHRTPQGGRNFEYFSEDPVVSGTIGSAMAKGAEDQGIVVFMKHFVLNDQETNARSGILVWSNEQAIRELYLKPFEMTVKNSNIHGAMSSFSYIGPVWAGANSDLLYGILRDEWGFKGMVSSDAVFGFMKAQDAIVNGNDLMLDIMSNTKQERELQKAFKQNPDYIGNGLKQSAKHIFYTLLQTNLYK